MDVIRRSLRPSFKMTQYDITFHKSSRLTQSLKTQGALHSKMHNPSRRLSNVVHLKDTFSMQQHPYTDPELFDLTSILNA